ncbi:PulJ/GspJ family protein [Nocardioides ochotonae]|uniref:PulJ/GspJ family protein n=1 Tax=Nocardioides ochotonae TaxID=2685869 RepID=UPI00140C3365|nr:prepilin-type N-terminal cleavage/methylation domain-containing protein [Nocardioides ochotonae]
MTRRRCSPGAFGDRGMTLAELLVAMAIFTILMTGLGTTAVLVIRTTAALENRLDNATQSQVSVDAVSKVLRTAVLPEQATELACPTCADTALKAATRTRVQFYANLNTVGSAPLLVTLELERDTHAAQTSGQLVQRIQRPIINTATQSYSYCDATLPTCSVQKRVLARGLAWPAVDTFFYYDSGGTLITLASLGDVELPLVSSVEIALKVQTVRGNTRYKPATVFKRVRLPNAEINVLVDN